MVNEKAMRTGTLLDRFFPELVESHDAVIKVAVSSNVRQVGKLRLMRKIAEFLRNEGYNNVTAVNEYGKALSMQDPDPLLVYPTDKLQLSVQIKIEEV